MIAFSDTKTIGRVVALTISQSFSLVVSLVTSKSCLTTPVAADTDIKVTLPGVLDSDDHWAASGLYFLK